MSFLNSLFGGGETTTDTSGTTTQEVSIKPWSSGQRDILRASTGNIADLARGMNPQETQALFQQMFGAFFDPAAAGIRQSYETLGNQQYQQSASRGMAGSSKQEGQDIKRTSMEARDTEAARNQAIMSAFQSVLAEQENRRAQMGALMNNMNSVWQQRLARSGVTTNTTGTSMTNAPANVFGTLGTGAGLAIGAGWQPLDIGGV